MSVGAILVAAGSGARAGGGVPKQYRLLAGRPVLEWSLRALSEGGVDAVAVVIGPEQAALAAPILARWPFAKPAPGGATRSASVRAGLNLLPESHLILVHDAARPGLRAITVRALIDAVRAGARAAAPAIPVADTLRRAPGEDQALIDVDRADLVRIQTPQAFPADVLREAYSRLASTDSFTDDLAVVTAGGGVRPRLIRGDPRLMKLTYAEDFEIMEALLASGRLTCTGMGVDAHRFGPGNYVTLCGVRIEHDKGLVGHSDADAGWHALVDAILGALGEGDIGAHFPPSDPQWAGADSERFLRHAVELAASKDARVVHVDITLICERPKIGPHREAMRARTAEVLALPLSRVSVKATTTERMGFLGREEGLAAQAVATLDLPR